MTKSFIKPSYLAEVYQNIADWCQKMALERQAGFNFIAVISPMIRAFYKPLKSFKTMKPISAYFSTDL